ncbi:MAG: hypothetical protein HYW15_00545 [Candidatus Giovannonibacteria bacterium]|nr:MAG: hypothetical protein HYW15_00545 [Candidatus Giovannonibacteria bacterium]
MENYLTKRNIIIAEKKSAQDRQDDIFRKMSADKKVELGSAFWRLAKDLVGNKISHGTNRSETTSG